MTVFLWSKVRTHGTRPMLILDDVPETAAELRTPAGREAALTRLIFEGWGAPIRNAEEHRAELEAAGLEVLRLAPPVPGARLFLARRPPV